MQRELSEFLETVLLSHVERAVEIMRSAAAPRDRFAAAKRILEWPLGPKALQAPAPRRAKRPKPPKNLSTLTRTEKYRLVQYWKKITGQIPFDAPIQDPP